MSARSITVQDRRALSPSALARLADILDFDVGDDWLHDHPPGDCRPVGGPMDVDEHESQPRGPIA